MKTALVTGGCGFLGSSIVRELLERGIKVRALALPKERTDNVDGLDVDIRRGDLMDRASLDAALEGVDTLFHCAALYQAWVPDPTKMYEVNVRGTLHVLEAARRAHVQRSVCTASIVALGRPPKGTLGDEQTAYEAWDLDFPYSRSKYLSLGVARDYASFGDDVRIVCPGVVFGPRDLTPTPSGKMILDAMKDHPAVYYEGGISYVDVRDAARAHVLAAERGARGELYVATAHNLDALAFMRAIDEAVGRRRRYVKLPVSVVRASILAADAVARRTGKEPLLTRNFFEYSLVPSFFSNEKSRRELGMSYRPIQETLSDAIADFRRRGVAP